MSFKAVNKMCDTLLCRVGSSETAASRVLKFVTGQVLLETLILIEATYNPAIVKNQWWTDNVTHFMLASLFYICVLDLCKCPRAWAWFLIVLFSCSFGILISYTLNPNRIAPLITACGVCVIAFPLLVRWARATDADFERWELQILLSFVFLCMLQERFQEAPSWVNRLFLVLFANIAIAIFVAQIQKLEHLRMDEFERHIRSAVHINLAVVAVFSIVYYGVRR